MTPLIFLTAISLASPHKAVISDTNISYTRDSHIYIDIGVSIPVTYHGYDEEEAIKSFYIIKNASMIARQYLLSDNMSISDCKQLAIDIYDLTSSDINNRGITAFFNWDNKDFDRVFALYDSILSPPGRSSIFITASNKFDNKGLDEEKRKEILSHEIMHYWQDRTCNVAHDIEKQASKFGLYAKDRI